MKKSFELVCLLAIISISACTQTIDLVLPKYEPKLVVEFYLEENKPLRCLLQESLKYTDTARNNLVNNAIVVLSYEGQSDTLRNMPYVENTFGKVYNYFNPKMLSLKPNVGYALYIKDGIGREIRGTTRLKPAIAMDSLVERYDEKGNGSVGVIFSDPQQEKNFYRLLAYKKQVVVPDSNNWDIRFNDQAFNGQKFSFFTGFTFNPGDTVIGRLYHISSELDSYFNSVSNAESANGNPFTQPANIQSNVTGGLGIFSTLFYDERIAVMK